MTRLLLADDHQIVRQGLQILLENQEGITIVGEANNGLEVISIIERESVDIVLMDINMPVMDGITCTQRLKTHHPNIKVIALSMYSEMGFLEKMFESGSKGYLLKSCSKAELIEAITKVHNGHQYISDELEESFVKHLKTTKENAASIPRISKREKEILQLISEENTTAQIAQELYISVTTVETHRKNLLRKLGLKNTAGLMRFAFENSLVS